MLIIQPGRGLDRELLRNQQETGNRRHRIASIIDIA
jgi:hypothetical protein